MKPAILFLSMALVLCGCAKSSIQTRKQERHGAYSSLPAKTRELVDAGKIKVGMTPDAVYIAWGKPSEVLEGGSGDTRVTTWLYHGIYIQEQRYWAQRIYRHDRYNYSQPYLAHEYHPHSYVHAEVRFENGAVKDWQTLPRPHY